MHPAIAPRHSAAILFGVAVAWGGAAHASGFQAAELSARARGMANAGAVALTGADAIALNPAASARAGREAVVGGALRRTSLTLRDGGSSLTRPGGPSSPAGGTDPLEDPAEDFLAPNLALAAPLGERIALGVSITKPFHLRLEYPASPFTRYDLVRNRIEMTEVRGALAVKAAPWLDLGLSLDAQETRAALGAASPNLAVGSPDGLQQLTAKGWDFGWGAGALAHLEEVTLGVSYRSAVARDLKGRLAMSGLLAPLDAANFDAPATVSFSTPWTLALGARWQATPDLAIHIQVQRNGWREYDAIGLAFAGQTASIAQGYHDTTDLAAGAEWRANRQWTVRGGVAREPTPTPDLMREPGVPDSDRTTWALGASFTPAPDLRLDLSLAWSDFEAARLHRDLQFYAGTPAATTATIRGELDREELSLGMALRTGF